MTQDFLPDEICNPHLPLAVYYEAATHLRQVTGVQAELLPQRSHQFDYSLSQIGGLRIQLTSEADQMTRQQVQQILTYYGDRFGQWQAIA